MNTIYIYTQDGGKRAGEPYVFVEDLREWLENKAEELNEQCKNREEEVVLDLLDELEAGEKKGMLELEEAGEKEGKQ